MKYSDTITNKKISEALNREWLITNGIGGYASQSLIGANTRKYHGLLVAPLTPPARRFLVLSKVDESIEIDGKEIPLYTNISNDYLTEGFKYLVDFKKEYIPIFTYNVNGIWIKKYICMRYGENTVTILYRILNKNKEAVFNIAPILNFRDFHTINYNHEFKLKQINYGQKIKLIIDNNSETPIYIHCSEGKYFKHTNDTFFNMYYPKEAERGFDAVENHIVSGVYSVNLSPNEEKNITFVCSLEENIEEIDSMEVISKEVARLGKIIANTDLIKNKDLKSDEEKNKDRLIQDLIIGADNFLVNRPKYNLHTLIAGYPWFLDWGRDSLISLEGLLLITKRFEMAKEVLLTNIKDVKFGLVPNGYSGYDNRPLYNSADSSLLLFEQIHKYLEYTQDFDFVEKDIYPLLKKIIESYSNRIDVDGNNIYLDEDNLISAGTENTQITWMDVKIDGEAVTPRNGKTVELNALWYNALKILSKLAKKFGDLDLSKQYDQMAKKTKKSFEEKFYNKDKKCLYDVLGDSKVRPNQLFALSLSNPVLDLKSEEAKNILKVVKKKLLNNYGLKTLASDEDGYMDIYEGSMFLRDHSYHQGITWPWLLGLYYDSLKNIIKATKDKEEKDKYKKELKNLITNTYKTFFDEVENKSTIGSISEIYDSIKPYKARGTFAQGWSVAEVLRIITES